MRGSCHGHIDHDEMPMRYELHMLGTVLVEVHSAQPLRKLAFVDLCFNNSKVSVETCAGDCSLLFFLCSECSVSATEKLADAFKGPAPRKDGVLGSTM